MARPIELVKRDERVVCRTTALEKKAIELMAEEAGLSTSDWVRKTAMNKTVKVRFSPEEVRYFKEMQTFHLYFTKISNLIKQDNREVTQALLKEIKETQMQMQQHLKKFSK